MDRRCWQAFGGWEMDKDVLNGLVEERKLNPSAYRGRNQRTTEPQKGPGIWGSIWKAAGWEMKKWLPVRMENSYTPRSPPPPHIAGQPLQYQQEFGIFSEQNVPPTRFWTQREQRNQVKILHLVLIKMSHLNHLLQYFQNSERKIVYP